MPAPPSATNYLWNLISSRTDLTILAELMASLDGFTSQLADMQRSKMTVFLPSDEAWEGFFEETDTNVTVFAEHPVRLTNLLMYHIYTTDAYLYADYQPLTMASGDPLYPCKLAVSGAKGLYDMAGRSTGLVDKRQVGGRVMVYVTDRVLLNIRPKTIDEALALNTQFSAFRQAMAAANYTGLLASSTASVTVLVPTNSAFDEALHIMNMTFADLLVNHTEDGGLLQTIVSSHITPSPTTYRTYEIWMNGQIFNTLNSCSSFATRQNDTTWDMVLKGIGMIDEARVMSFSAPASGAPGADPLVQWLPAILDEDLIAGDHALMHVLDKVFLPADFSNTKTLDGANCYIIGRGEPGRSPYGPGPVSSSAPNPSNATPSPVSSGTALVVNALPAPKL